MTTEEQFKEAMAIAHSSTQSGIMHLIKIVKSMAERIEYLEKLVVDVDPTREAVREYVNKYIMNLNS